MSEFHGPAHEQRSRFLFVQDSWKVTHKFTLVGLRWDYVTYLRESAPQFLPHRPEPECWQFTPELLSMRRRQLQLPLRIELSLCDPGPRLGAAYQLTPKTVFRAGFGLLLSKTAHMTITPSAAIILCLARRFSRPPCTCRTGFRLPVIHGLTSSSRTIPNIPGQIGTAPSPGGSEYGTPAPSAPERRRAARHSGAWSWKPPLWGIVGLGGRPMEFCGL